LSGWTRGASADHLSVSDQRADGNAELDAPDRWNVRSAFDHLHVAQIVDSAFSQEPEDTLSFAVPGFPVDVFSLDASRSK